MSERRKNERGRTKGMRTSKVSKPELNVRGKENGMSRKRRLKKRTKHGLQRSERKRKEEDRI